MRADQAIRLTELVMRLYFIDRNYKALERYISAEAVWTGTGGHEIGFGPAGMRSQMAESAGREGVGFQIVCESYTPQILSAEVVCVGGHVDICAVLDGETLFTAVIRLTLVYRREGRFWKIAHLHNSLPEGGGNSYVRLYAGQVEKAQKMDTLTGIYNMEGFVTQAEKMLDLHPSLSYSVLKFGINQFRYINAVLGYKKGDLILMEIAKILQAECREGELCGRIEKDNFALLLHYNSPEQLDQRVQELVERQLGKQIQERMEIKVYVTGGICLLERGAPGMMKAVLDRTLTAQRFAVKRRWESHFAYYDPGMEHHQFLEQELMEAAGGAMERGEFQLYFQPQVNLTTGQPVGAEVLSRWIKADGSCIMPDEFIPVFEQNGFIKELDFYMLEKLCSQMRRWADSGLPLIPISINQSRNHLEDADYVENFSGIVDKWGIPHSLIAFELTETAFMEYDCQMKALAEELRSRGYRLDIDDFGTGYTALNLLALTDPDVLKIDRSLIVDAQNPKGQLVLKKVIEMAKGTNTTIICEGVETAEQARYLRELQCDMAQGYYYYRPMKASDFEKQILKR